ncbi:MULTISPECIES: hypothetical protein [Paraburkholderia]|uniref:hypothetical protein n=1 Tax=Paraburkholderia TaxID=1822464 RepID=UPI0022525670|nr:MULTISPECIES: hypothetical protein [Paraburkholderia]MCX4165324.1 hypothetical protein [Paraburkholderia megapolitana]MDN7160816.1 hypothetical protein [Paraburkholderia sp. CHISQ3]MDQ6497863.1 hypothetical protein [Paraburkholderia megapolitana]
MRVRSLIAVCPVLLFGALFTGPHQVAYAQTPPASFGSTLGALVAANAAANGFAAADPRIAATAAAIGARAAALAAAAASAAGTALGAVSWGAVAAAAGIGAVLGAVPVTLGNDTLTQWQFNHDGTVSVYAPPSGTPPGGGGSPVGGTVSPYAPLSAGVVYWYIMQITASSADAAGEAFMEQAGLRSWSIKCALTEPFENQAVCTGTQTNQAGTEGKPSFTVASSGQKWTGPTCPSGMGTASGGCTAFAPQQPPPPPPPVTTSPAVAAAGTSAADQADSLNPKVAAATVDALWSSVASQPGYQGLPYPVNAPVTGAQAAGVESSIGASWPTVGSFTGGAGTTAGGSSSTPFDTSVPAASNPASSVPVATNPGSGAQINIGPDPGIGAPGLEQTPTATQIPGLRCFAVSVSHPWFRASSVRSVRHLVGVAGTGAAVLRSANGYRAAQRGLPDRVAGGSARAERKRCGWAGPPSLQSCCLRTIAPRWGSIVGAWRCPAFGATTIAGC